MIDSGASAGVEAGWGSKSARADFGLKASLAGAGIPVGRVSKAFSSELIHDIQHAIRKRPVIYAA